MEDYGSGGQWLDWPLYWPLLHLINVAHCKRVSVINLRSTWPPAWLKCITSLLCVFANHGSQRESLFTIWISLLKVAPVAGQIGCCKWYWSSLNPSQHLVLFFSKTFFLVKISANLVKLLRYREWIPDRLRALRECKLTVQAYTETTSRKILLFSFKVNCAKKSITIIIGSVSRSSKPQEKNPLPTTGHITTTSNVYTSWWGQTHLRCESVCVCVCLEQQSDSRLNS